ncbi:hypothetical protein B0J12DRAFT_660369 [Macrophomina phaseolina]|uniref:Uncharacterized protein n=1 Tax=Macrophomina phaseolina TaxID=35725 RepID=A0ABQ8GCH6_9PEZI|nr:hypothetical protein B0J12DRAFT_660369 [Macrophomina phaseolina]
MEYSAISVACAACVGVQFSLEQTASPAADPKHYSPTTMTTPSQRSGTRGASTQVHLTSPGAPTVLPPSGSLDAENTNSSLSASRTTSSDGPFTGAFISISNTTIPAILHAHPAIPYHREGRPLVQAITRRRQDGRQHYDRLRLAQVQPPGRPRHARRCTRTREAHG